MLGMVYEQGYWERFDVCLPLRCQFEELDTVPFSSIDGYCF